MQRTSFKRIAFLGFSVPAIIIAGAVCSVLVGNGQAVMLPSTVATLVFYGALIAVGAAWRDNTPQLPESKRAYFIAFVAATIALGAAVWWVAANGGSALSWRPAIAAALCLWFGVSLASVVPRRILA